MPGWMVLDFQMRAFLLQTSEFVHCHPTAQKRNPKALIPDSQPSHKCLALLANSTGKTLSVDSACVLRVCERPEPCVAPGGLAKHRASRWALSAPPHHLQCLELWDQGSGDLVSIPCSITLLWSDSVSFSVKENSQQLRAGPGLC